MARPESRIPFRPKAGAEEWSDRLAAESRMAARRVMWPLAQQQARRECRLELRVEAVEPSD